MEEVSIFHRYLCWSMADLGVGFPGGSGICLQCRGPRFNLWIGKIPWRREWLPTQVFLPGEFHGQRSVAGYSPWGCKELRTAEWLTLSVFFFFSQSIRLGCGKGRSRKNWAWGSGFWLGQLPSGWWCLSLSYRMSGLRKNRISYSADPALAACCAWF